MTLRALLEARPEVVHARLPREHRPTLLNYCAANGTERQHTPPNAAVIARLLLERGADPNATCSVYGGGWTTMSLMLTSAHPAAAGLDGELTSVLLEFGAPLEAGDLMGAIEYGLTRSVQAFADAGATIENLYVAAGLGRTDVVEQLLSQGADINTRFEQGGYGTALHGAAAMNQADTARFLLDRGADASLHNRWDATPADTAWFFKHRALAKEIEERRRQSQASDIR